MVYGLRSTVYGAPGEPVDVSQGGIVVQAMHATRRRARDDPP
jgi:hypothetical protein